MIKEIKHQRCVRKFELFLSSLKIVYFNGDTGLYSYNEMNTSFIIVNCTWKRFVILYNLISDNHLDYDLERDFIIELINDKYNTNNYELIIND